MTTRSYEKFVFSIFVTFRVAQESGLFFFLAYIVTGLSHQHAKYYR